MKALPLDVRQLDDIKKKFHAAFSIHICSDSGQTDFCIKVDGKDHT
jgi:hypothetical protein